MHQLKGKFWYQSRCHCGSPHQKFFVLGILGIEGQKWQQTRAFIYDHLQTRLGEEDLDNVIIDQANNVVRAIKMESGSVNPDDYFYSANVNIMSYVLFGRTLEFRGTEYRALTKTLTGAQIALAGSPLQRQVSRLTEFTHDSMFDCRAGPTRRQYRL